MKEKQKLFTLKTPVIKILDNNNKWKIFLSLFEYETWKESKINEVDFSKIKLKYYKGIATFKSSYINHIFQNLKRYVKEFIYDSKTDNSIIDAFSDKHRKEKKEKLIEFEKVKNVLDYNQKQILISDFINFEICNYFDESDKRCIPNIKDSLTSTRRKIIWGIINKEIDSIKLEAISGMLIEDTNYDHSIKILEEAIIKMTSDHPLSNNIPMFNGYGVFGSKYSNGKLTSEARYLSITKSTLIPFLFKKEDEILY